MRFGSRSSARRFVVACGFLAFPLAVALSGTQISVFPDCLSFSSSASRFVPTDHLRECTTDALNLGDDEAIQGGEKFFNIAPEEIRFIGCAAAPFDTFPPLGLSKSQFTVYYPTAVQLTHDEYVAPLLHEMGHVFQLKQAGSYAKLKASLDDATERIELGADFMAGIGADRLGLEPKAFLLNLSLVGSYNNRDFDYHGRPEDRASAFRNGYFYQDKQATVADSYSDFQDNRFAQIKHE